MGVAIFPFPVTKHLTRSYVTEEGKRRGEKEGECEREGWRGRKAQRREREGTRGKE